MTSTSSPAGPSRHRRKQTAENWDDDFEFALPSRSKPPPSASSSKHLDQDSGESRANQSSRHAVSSNKAKDGKGKEVEEEEDWDTGGKWDEPSPEPPKPSRTSIQVRRGSKGPAPLKIPSNHPSARHLGLPRSSPSSSSPLPSPPSQSSSLSATAPDQTILPTSLRRPKSATAEKIIARSTSIQRQPSSASFAPPPTAPTVAISNDSSSSLISWTKFNRSSPDLQPSSLADIASSSISPHPRKSDKARELRHMKSGDIMPPPPVPGSSLLRRKSKKARDRDKDVRESQVPFSPSMEQLREVDGKKGFWKRFSGNAAGMGKGSPISLYSVQELRRRRSSSVGSPTKIRPNLSPSNQPPLPPLPNNIRSPSAASSTSANSATSSASQSAFRSAGITGILRRSTSSLIRRSPSAKKNGSGQGTPPSAYAPPSPVRPRVPTRTSSRSSQLSTEGDSAMIPTMQVKHHSRKNPSVSRGYHLPSPAPGSPYRPGSGYFDAGDVPPLPHSASLTSQMSGRSQRGYSGSITGTDTEYEGDEMQTQPKRKKKSISGVISIGKSRGESTGWTGDGWNGFPPKTSASSGAMELSSSTTSQVVAPPLSTRTSSRSNLRLPSSQSVHLPPTSPPIFDGPEDPPRSFFTLRRLSSLSKKHGRRLSGGFKFGTNGSSSSAEERKEDTGRRGKLETVVGSPIKGGRQAEDRIDHDHDDQVPNRRQVSPVRSTVNGESQSIKRKEDRFTRAGSVSAPTSVLKPPSRDFEAEWTKSEDPVSGLPKPSVVPTINGKNASISAKEAKERRRQSWNDFVIPRNVLDKQRELKRGIEGVRRFAGGVETLKSLLAAHSDLTSRLALSSDPANLARFDSLDREFAQWWEMATVLIEVGSTGQGIGQEQSVSFLPDAESPKRSRRITLASDEAKLASDLMRRTQSTPLHPAYPPPQSSSVIVGKKEPRKSSLPDPEDVAQSSGFLSGGPPRASPDLWRASTGRQDLSKRQLEVLRTMLRTPVGDPSVPQRNDPLRGMSSISNSSTSASIAPRRQEDNSGRHAYRPSISRASTTDSRASDRSFVHFDSPRTTRTDGTPAPRGSETFPSPNDSAYIVPSQSFPSPITASTLAYGRPTSGSDPSKMRRGSKVGLAGLREFLKGLKGKESKKDLRAIRTNQVSINGLPTPGIPSYNPSREGLPLPLSPTSPTAKYPFAWRHKPTPSYTDLHHPLTPPTQPDYRRPSDTPSFTNTPPTPLTSITPTKPTVAGPPVSGKERRRPGLRGIFRAGSGSWSDLVNSGSMADKRASKDGIPGPQYPRVGSGGSTESAPAASRNLLRSTPSMDQFGSTGVRSISGPSRLSVAEEGEMTVRPRKSRIMGLGWPEEAAAAREMDRTVSNVSASTETSAPGEEVDGRESEEMEMQIALTPESLPVLLEYLRQCETKLGEWKEKVREIV